MQPPPQYRIDWAKGLWEPLWHSRARMYSGRPSWPLRRIASAFRKAGANSQSSA